MTDWLKFIEGIGSVGLVFYLFARYLPRRERDFREERAELARAFSDSNDRVLSHCQAECDQFREEAKLARQQFTDSLLKMLENHETANHRTNSGPGRTFESGDSGD